jgi:hypothetical protein
MRLAHQRPLPPRRWTIWTSWSGWTPWASTESLRTRRGRRVPVHRGRREQPLHGPIRHAGGGSGQGPGAGSGVSFPTLGRCSALAVFPSGSPSEPGTTTAPRASGAAALPLACGAVTPGPTVASSIRYMRHTFPTYSTNPQERHPPNHTPKLDRRLRTLMVLPSGRAPLAPGPSPVARLYIPP